MDRVTLLHDLEAVEMRLARCHKDIAHQHDWIAELEWEGQPTVAAKSLLAVLLETKVLHEQAQHRILEELDRISERSPTDAEDLPRMSKPAH
jgi:hypothetical protein